MCCGGRQQSQAELVSHRRGIFGSAVVMRSGFSGARDDIEGLKRRVRPKSYKESAHVSHNLSCFLNKSSFFSLQDFGGTHKRVAGIQRGERGGRGRETIIAAQ